MSLYICYANTRKGLLSCYITVSTATNSGSVWELVRMVITGSKHKIVRVIYEFYRSYATDNCSKVGS